MNKAEMELYITQLEDENTRLKMSNKSLKTNNKGLLEGHKKLQKRINELKKELAETNYKVEDVENISDELRYIEAQLQDGYIDLGIYDDKEVSIVSQAIKEYKNRRNIKDADFRKI